jgi:hypothetical protein
MFSTYPPVPEVKPERQAVKPLPIPEVFPDFVEALKRNRTTKTLDRILCRNAKCRYECVWTRADNETWICIYCLDLYDWMQLGDIHNFELRGCVGCYARPQGGVPSTAAIGTRLRFKIDNVSSFNPFGQ